MADGTFLISVTGPLDTDTGKPLIDELAALMTVGAHRVVIDLPGGSALDRPALSVVEGAATELRRGGGEVVLVSLDPRVLELLASTGLERPIRVVPALAEALHR